MTHTPTPLQAYEQALNSAPSIRRPLRHCATCNHVSAKHILDYKAKDWRKASLLHCEVIGCSCRQWVEGERY